MALWEFLVDAKHINQFYRSTTLTLHPDRVRGYDAKVREQVADLFKQLGTIKEEQLTLLKMCRIDPKDELEKWQKAQEECEQLKKENTQMEKENARKKDENTIMAEKIKIVGCRNEDMEYQTEKIYAEIEKGKSRIEEANRRANASIEEARQLREKLQQMMDSMNPTDFEKIQPQTRMKFFFLIYS